MFELSLETVSKFAGVLTILIGVILLIIACIRRKRPHRCSLEVYATCVKVIENASVSLLSGKSTQSYQCVYEFEYDSKTFRVMTPSSTPQPIHKEGTSLKLYLNQSDLTDFWYRDRKGFWASFLFSVLLVLIGAGILILTEFLMQVPVIKEFFK